MINRDNIPIIVFSVITGMALPLSGDRACWIVPPMCFGFLVVIALVDRRRPLTPLWMLAFAAVSVAIGFFLRWT